MTPERANSAESSPAAGGEPDAKRRKIRKGTRSCWECKRRKVKCNYPSPEDQVCDGCRRRGTNCVSQEFPEEPSTANGSNRVVGDRLGKMEALVEQLVKKMGPPVGAGELILRNFAGNRAPADGLETAQNPNSSLPTPDSQAADSSRYPETSDNVSVSLDHELIVPRHKTSPEHHNQRDYDVPYPCGSAQSREAKYEQLSKKLHAAYPSQHDVDIIVNASGVLPSLFYQVIWLPYSEVFSGENGTPEDLAVIPPPTAHPALIAQRMLMLSIFMQQLLPSFTPQIKELDESTEDICRRVVDLAETHVVNNDELVGTLEGLRCIMLTAVFQANSGNLRRSWLSFRRGMVVAQLMGLHREQPPTIRQLDPKSKADPRHMWFRLMYADRSLALMLGLPVGSYDTSIISDEAMQRESPMGRLERLHCVAAMKLLQRNEEIHNGKDTWAWTQEIDMELQRAARILPSRWWTVPHLADSKNEMELCKETMRLINHFYHYYLLNQLHVPFMLRSSPDNKYDYSRMTCVNASRELLARFIDFRSINLVACSCRGVDFFAFMAALTLILAHLDAHRHGSGNFLVHQRLSDRGMMERVVDNFDELHTQSRDVVSAESSRVLKRLLAMETDAANGNTYSTNSEEPDLNECGMSESNQSVKLTIPYFGTIRITKDGLTKTTSPETPQAPVNTTPQGIPTTEPSVVPGSTSTGSTPATAAFSQAEQASASGSDWIPLQYTEPLQTPSQPTPLVSGSYFGDPMNPQAYVPNIMANTEDWAFQGVDMAFFDSLMRGANTPVLAGNGSWAPAGHVWNGTL